jgi:cation diffusion facilitator family transporter
MSDAGTMRRVGALVLAANLALAAGKTLVFLESGSLAVGGEAVNSFADAAYSVFVLVGLYLTTQPPDFEHPHGHERIEPFVALFVATGVFAAGGAILYQAARTILAGETGVLGSLSAVGILVVSAVVKYALYRYAYARGEATNSPALRATALDNRNDVFTASAALVGVLGVRAGYPLLDPIAAAVVALAVLYTGVEIVRDNVGYLVGSAPPEALRAEIVERALAHPEVAGAHDVVAHYVGPEVDVSLHVEVEGDHTLLEAHAIETAVIEAIQSLPEVDDVFVHVDPKELGEWKRDPDVDDIAHEGREDWTPGATEGVEPGASEDTESDDPGE